MGVFAALTVPAADSTVTDFISGVYSLGAEYLGVAIGAAIIIVVMKAIVPWLTQSLRSR